MKKKFLAMLALAILLALSMAPAAWAADSSATTDGAMYGIVVDGGGGSADLAHALAQNDVMSGGVAVGGGSTGSFGGGEIVGNGGPFLVIFTQAGTKETYNLSENCSADVNNSSESAMKWMGQPVAYRLNDAGEITELHMLSNILSNGEEIKVVDNNYLKNESTGTFYTLADNAVIFEVGEDNHNVDVYLINRTDLLTGGNFVPETIIEIQMGTVNGTPFFADLYAYAKFAQNADGTIAALAYTTPSRMKLHYGVIEDGKIVDDNHAGDLGNGESDYGIKLIGNNNIYDLHPVAASLPLNNGKFVIYTISGNELNPIYIVNKGNGLKNFAKQVSSFNSGLLNFAESVTPWVNDFNVEAGSELKSVPTNAQTKVFVNDMATGEYVEGTLADIGKVAWVYVPVVNENGFAECLLVDEYSHRDELGYVAVNGLTLNKKDLTLELKGSEQLTATVTPENATNKSVTWTSSNENVAVVDKDGKVTAVSVGSATITAVTEKQQAECLVTVKATINEALDNVLDNPNASQEQVQETIKALDKDELAAAIVADKELMTKIAQLENKLGGTTVNVAVEVAVKAADVIVVGAKVNDVKAALQIAKPENENIKVDVPENYTDFRFSMNLVNAETQAKVDVVVPMQMTLPIPIGDRMIFNADTFKLWHNHNGQNQEVNASVSQKDGKWFASFTVDSFSDFVMTYQEIKLDEVYTVTFDTNGGVLVERENPEYVQKSAADNYTMPKATKSGYTFKGWQHSEDEKNVTAAGAVYKITDDTKFVAVWDKNSSGGSSGGGSHRNPNSGGTTTPTKPGTTEKPGTTTEKPGTTKPSGTVTALNINNVFADVKNGEWYSEAVAYVYNQGMMNGTEKGFEPNAATTRAMLVTMLYRLEGEPSTGAANFSDVASGQWFSKAIAWASANGVVNGYENGTFAPNAAITREQLAAVLYRYAQAKGQDVSAKGDLSAFSDSAKMSGWATEAMQWAVGAGIIEGDAQLVPSNAREDNNNLRPQGNATRAEVAMMIMRFMQK